jgi:hypothetical protein
MNDTDSESLKKIFLKNGFKKFSFIIPSLKNRCYFNKTVFDYTDVYEYDWGGPGRRTSLFDFDFLYHENNKSKNNDLARKMFYEHVNEYKKIIKLWNNDTSNKKMRLIKTYEIDYHDFKKIPTIEFTRVRPKIVKDDDVFNYSECMLENFIKIKKYEDIFESNKIEKTLYENEIKNKKVAYNIFDKSLSIDYEIKEKGYIKEDNKSHKDKSKCDVLKDYITVINSNKNIKNDISFRYNEIKIGNSFMSRDYKKFCTVEIEENN